MTPATKSPTLGHFLQELLKAQGEALTRLAAFFGEEKILELLENRDEERDREIYPGAATHELAGEPNPQDPSFYGALQGVVFDIKLAEPLEFHLWAYPGYRRLIEGSYPLSTPLSPTTVTALADAALKYGSVWLDTLHIPPSVFPQARGGVEPVWVRFRAQMLKGAGQSPFRSV